MSDPMRRDLSFADKARLTFMGVVAVTHALAFVGAAVALLIGVIVGGDKHLIDPAWATIALALVAARVALAIIFIAESRRTERAVAREAATA